jgi:hypothetical protein
MRMAGSDRGGTGYGFENKCARAVTGFWAALFIGVTRTAIHR